MDYYHYSHYCYYSYYYHHSDSCHLSLTAPLPPPAHARSQSSSTVVQEIANTMDLEAIFKDEPETLYLEVIEYDRYVQNLAKYTDETAISVEMTFKKATGKELDMSKVRIIAAPKEMVFKCLFPSMIRAALLEIWHFNVVCDDDNHLKLRARATEARTTAAVDTDIYWFHVLADADSKTTVDMIHAGIKTFLSANNLTATLIKEVTIDGRNTGKTHVAIDITKAAHVTESEIWKLKHVTTADGMTHRIVLGIEWAKKWEVCRWCKIHFQCKCKNKNADVPVEMKRKARKQKSDDRKARFERNQGSAGSSHPMH